MTPPAVCSICSPLPPPHPTAHHPTPAHTHKRHQRPVTHAPPCIAHTPYGPDSQRPCPPQSARHAVIRTPTHTPSHRSMASQARGTWKWRIGPAGPVRAARGARLPVSITVPPRTPPRPPRPPVPCGAFRPGPACRCSRLPGSMRKQPARSRRARAASSRAPTSPDPQRRRADLVSGPGSQHTA